MLPIQGSSCLADFPDTIKWRRTPKVYISFELSEPGTIAQVSKATVPSLCITTIASCCVLPVKQIGTVQYIVEVNDRPMVRLRCTRLYIYIFPIFFHLSRKCPPYMYAARKRLVFVCLSIGAAKELDNSFAFMSRAQDHSRCAPEPTRGPKRIV